MRLAPHIRTSLRSDLTLKDLPADLAEQVDAIQQDDPESLRQMLQYVVARKVVFDTLRDRMGLGQA